MLRPGVDLLGLAALDDLALAHDQNLIGHVLDHRQVMADEEVGQAKLFLQVEQQVEHGGLYADIERAHAFVTDDDLGLHGQAARNRDALALTARKLVWVLAEILAPQAHFFQQRQRQPGALILILADAVDAHRLGQNLPHGKARIQAGVGVLKNDLDAAAVNAHLRGAQLRQVLALKQDTALGRIGESGQHHAQRRFAGARLTHHAQRAALVQGKVSVLDSAEHAAFEQTGLELVVLVQTLDLNQRRCAQRRGNALLGHQRTPIHDVIDHRQPSRPCVQTGTTGQQRLRIGIARCAEDALHRAGLAHLPIAHHHHLAGNFTDQTEIVADEEDAHFLALLQPRQQVHDLALHRHIERRSRLVRNQQLGFAGNRHRDHDALLLPAG